MNLSIITIAYNNLEGLRKTFESLKGQSVQDYEWIVVDGGSSDGSVNFLKKTHADWQSKPDNGIYDAMNKGIDRATKSHVLFLNSGDCLAHPQTLELIAERIEQGAYFIYGDALEDDLKKTLHYKRAKPYTKISKGLFTHHQSMVYHKNDLRYDLQYKIASDFEFTYRYLCDVIAQDLPVHYIPEPLCVFEGGGVSQTSAVLGRKEQYQARLQHQISGAKRVYVMQTFTWKFRGLFPKFFWFLKRF